MLSAEAVGGVVGAPDRVRRYWPAVTEALQSRGVDSDAARAAFAANAITETRFSWIREKPAAANTVPGGAPFSAYEPGTPAGRILGNTVPGDGYRFRGGGPIQLTGRDNYARIGRMIGVDLVSDPDLITDPVVGAQAAVAYLASRGAFSKADLGDWDGVRRAVQPGNDPAGMSRFKAALLPLLSAVQAPADATGVTPYPPLPPTPTLPGSGAAGPAWVGLLVAGSLLAWLAWGRR